MHSSDEVFGSFPPFLCSTFPQYSLAPWLQRYSACLLIELPPIIVFSPPSPSRMQWLLSSMVVSDVHVSTASSLAIFFFSIQLHINTSLFFGEAFFPPPPSSLIAHTSFPFSPAQASKCYQQLWPKPSALFRVRDVMDRKPTTHDIQSFHKCIDLVFNHRIDFQNDSFFFFYLYMGLK